MSADLGGGGGASAPAADPRIAQLEAAIAEREAALAEASTTLQALQPYSELITDLVNDADFRGLVTEVKNGRQAFIDTQKKTIPPELQPLAEDVRYLKDYVEEQRNGTKAQREAAERERAAQATAWQKSAESFILNTVNQTPGFLTGKKLPNGDDELTDDGYIMLHAVKALAEKHGISFEEAYKRADAGNRFAPKNAATPPSSLPVDAGNVGIPAIANRTPDGVDFVTELERRIAMGTA